MIHNMLNDLSNLTTISEKTLSKLSEKGMYCICDCIQEALLNGDNTVQIDIGLGLIQIKIEDKTVLYRFIPSNTLEQKINETIDTGHNPLQLIVEQALIDRMTNTYKDLL